MFSGGLRMTFDEIRQMALSFPGVEEHIVLGGPTFRIGKRFLACIAKIDKDTLVIKVPDRREREYLLTTKSEVYYLTDHYASFEALLVRMPVADPVELRQLFEQAWMTYAPKRLVSTYKAND
jgi:hypothetical protein